MSELSKALGNAAPGHTIEFDGKTYTASLISQAVKVAFEKKLYDQAMAEPLALKQHLTSDQFYSWVREISAKNNNGDYAFVGADGNKFAQTPKGGVLLLSLILNCDETEAMRLMTAKTEEMKILLHTVASESFPGVTLPDPRTPQEGGKAVEGADPKS